MVLLDSFTRCNPWFDGPLILIHDGLPSSSHRRLTSLRHLDIRHRMVDARLLERVKAVAARHPPMRLKQRRFFSLEAFNLREYDTVLFIDSDVLCRGSAEGLLSADGTLVGCSDLVTRAGRVRDATTFLPRERRVNEEDADNTMLRRCFNAGVMVVRPGRLTSDTFDRLLASLDPHTWDEVRAGHTDQVLLNRCFHDRWTHAPSRYNWLVPPTGTKPDDSDRPPDDVVFVHFVGRPKPWERPLLTIARGARVEACRDWDAAHRRFLRARLLALDPSPTVRHALNVVRRAGSGLLGPIRAARARYSPVANE